VHSEGGLEPPRKRRRQPRAVARDLTAEAVVDHPFFSSQAGSSRNRQVRSQVNNFRLLIIGPGQAASISDSEGR
jgi:hypothetical protein